MKTLSITVGELAALAQNIDGLIVRNAAIPGSASFKMMSALRAAQPFVTSFQDQRLELFKKYGTESEETPGRYEVDPEIEDFEEFSEEQAAMANLEVEIDFLPLSLEEINGLQPIQVAALMPLIEA